MYLCYLDESGNIDPKASGNHFVLLGFSVPAASWKTKDQQIEAIKQRFDLGDVEIHTAWMARDYPEQRFIPDFENLSYSERTRAVAAQRSLNLARMSHPGRIKSTKRNYKLSAAYTHLTRDERLQCLDLLAAAVETWTDSRVFAEVQDKRHVGVARSFEIAFEQVVSRFDSFLTIATQEQGLIIQDNNPTVARKITGVMRRFHADGTQWTTIRRVIETPLFVDSELTTMVQIADLCAYAVRRFFDRGEIRLWGPVSSRIDRRDGVWVGIRHYTGQHPCTCEVCRLHGRYS